MVWGGAWSTCVLRAYSATQHMQLGGWLQGGGVALPLMQACILLQLLAAARLIDMRACCAALQPTRRSEGEGEAEDDGGEEQEVDQEEEEDDQNEVRRGGIALPPTAFSCKRKCSVEGCAAVGPTLTPHVAGGGW